MSDDDVRRAAEALYAATEWFDNAGATAVHGGPDHEEGCEPCDAIVELRAARSAYRIASRTALSRASASGGKPTAWGIENARGAMEPCHFYLSEDDARHHLAYLNQTGSIGKDRPYRVVPLYTPATVASCSSCADSLVRAVTAEKSELTALMNNDKLRSTIDRLTPTPSHSHLPMCCCGHSIAQHEMSSKVVNCCRYFGCVCGLFRIEEF